MLQPADPSRLDAEVLDALHGRSMLLTQDWTTAEIEALCALAETLQALDRRGRVPAFFPRQLFWALFFDQSTRTKSSWAGAGNLCASARLKNRGCTIHNSSMMPAASDSWPISKARRRTTSSSRDC